MDTNAVVIDKQHLYSIWKNCEGDQNHKANVVCAEVFSCYGILPEEMGDVAFKVRDFVSSTCKYFQKLWLKHYRNDHRVLSTEYFNSPFKLPTRILNEIPSSSMGIKRGRKLLCFEESSEAVKRRKTADLRAQFETVELAYATQMKLRAEGKIDVASIVKRVTQDGEFNAAESSSQQQQTSKVSNPYSDFEALALILDLGLTKHQYNQLRKEALQRNVPLYPSYYKVTEAKNSCYPPHDSLIISESAAEVKLAPLLEHTGRRIVQANADSLHQFTDDELLSITLTVKWGFDGTSGLSEYKMKFEGDDGTFSDKNVFVTSLVPIRATTNGKVLFQNKHPSSTRYCRPLRIQYIKETVSVTVAEQMYFTEQIDQLTAFLFEMRGRTIKMTFEMHLTMVDVKAINSMTATKSTQTCYICKATPIEMNNLERIYNKEINSAAYEYGLSPLHAKINFLNFFINLAYKLPVKKWKVTKELFDEVEDRKKLLQHRFKTEMGLYIDRPRSGGAGTSNDGNTARIFFQNPGKVAEITGINEELIRRCAVVLETLSCGKQIDVQKFDDYCRQTARKLVKEYPWYYMPVTVHKVLIHGSQVINHFLVPIGQLSEEAQESRNKDLKRYRLDHTRKVSRIAINEDLLHRLLESSDPYITSLRSNCRKAESKMSNDANGLLVLPEERKEDSSEDSDDDNA